MSLEALKTYLVAIEQALKAGNATEHTHRPALKALIEALGGADVRATNEPKQIACGAPDFIVARGVVPLGYVEAKDVGIDLAKAEKSEQLGRYRESLGNLVLTDYLEFRWYVDGQLRLSAGMPRPDNNGRIRWNADAASGVAQLLGQFIAADIPLKATPQDLATRMAGMGKLIRALIEQTFKAEDDKGELHGQFEAFRKVLIESLTAPQFADMYAQTLCYGLFAARCNVPAQGFTRQKAASALPKTNPFLRKLFNTIAGPDLDERIAWAVDQLAELLARADMAAILADFGKRTRQEDPVVHFYETFLAAYDPKMREARGVYYTPEPVVGYIVRCPCRQDPPGPRRRTAQPRRRQTRQDEDRADRKLRDPPPADPRSSHRHWHLPVRGDREDPRAVRGQRGRVAGVRGRTLAAATVRLRTADGALRGGAYEAGPGAGTERLRLRQR